MPTSPNLLIYVEDLSTGSVIYPIYPQGTVECFPLKDPCPASVSQYPCVSLQVYR